jgi:hypothetical protein
VRLRPRGGQGRGRGRRLEAKVDELEALSWRARSARVRAPRSVRWRATWGLGMGELDLRGDLRVVGVF